MAALASAGGIKINSTDSNIRQRIIGLLAKLKTVMLRKEKKCITHLNLLAFPVTNLGEWAFLISVLT